MNNILKFQKISSILLITVFIGCQKNPQVKSELSVGKFHQGGVIGYILRPGDPGYDKSIQHGIIYDTTNRTAIDKRAKFGCNGSKGVSGIKIGTGRSNTDSLVQYCNEPGTAARICEELVVNGYSDWYLPSKDELYKVRAAGWSSSNENSTDSAWSQFYFYGSVWGFDYGGYIAAKVNKNNLLTLRPVRSF